VEDFYCFSCGKRKSIEARSDKKIGRYKKSYLCKTCDTKAEKNTVESKRDPEELIGFSTFKSKHRAKALDNNAKKSYVNDRLYNYMKDNNII
jgi:hypothetical protein